MAWVVQLHRGARRKPRRTIYPGVASTYRRFDVTSGLEALRCWSPNLKGLAKGLSWWATSASRAISETCYAADGFLRALNRRDPSVSSCAEHSPATHRRQSLPRPTGLLRLFLTQASGRSRASPTARVRQPQEPDKALQPLHNLRGSMEDIRALGNRTHRCPGRHSGRWLDDPGPGFDETKQGFHDALTGDARRVLLDVHRRAGPETMIPTQEAPLQMARGSKVWWVFLGRGYRACYDRVLAFLASGPAPRSCKYSPAIWSSIETFAPGSGEPDRRSLARRRWQQRHVGAKGGVP